MEKKKKIDITKRLNKLVKARITPVVTYEHGSYRYTPRKSSGGNFTSDGYSESIYK
jgi:hypothetical protein